MRKEDNIKIMLKSLEKRKNVYKKENKIFDYRLVALNGKINALKWVLECPRSL